MAEIIYGDNNNQNMQPLVQQQTRQRKPQKIKYGYDWKSVLSPRQIQNINDMNGMTTANYERYSWDYSRYLNQPDADLRHLEQYDTYNFYVNEYPSLNVTKQIVDTNNSKLQNESMRLQFSTIQGDFKTRRQLRNLQIFSDFISYKYNIPLLVQHTYKLAQVFGVGWIFVDPWTYQIQKLGPWKVGVLESEMREGSQNLSKCLITKWWFPVSMLDSYIQDETVLNAIKNDSQFFKGCCLQLFFDREEGKRYVIINKEIVDVRPYTANRLPIEPIFFNSPLHGMRTTSLVEDLDSIQNEVDFLICKASEQTKLQPGALIFLRKGSGIVPQQINNRVGQIFLTEQGPGEPPPVTVVNQPLRDENDLAYLELLYNKAFEMAGISLLQAVGSSSLPSQTSGETMDQIERIESDRFQTQFMQMKQLYISVIDCIIQSVDDDMLVLPENSNRANITFGELKEAFNKINIRVQTGKAKQNDLADQAKLQGMTLQSGTMMPDQTTSFMEFPDIAKWFELANQTIDTIDKIIDDQLEGNPNIPVDIPFNFNTFMKELILTEQQFFINEKDTIYLDRLNQLDQLQMNYCLRYHSDLLLPFIQTVISNKQQVQQQFGVAMEQPETVQQ